MQDLSVTFIVLGYNNLEVTRETVKRLKSNLSKEHQILLLDNNSPTNLNPIAKEFPIHYLKSKENLGYAGGNNLAANYALKKFKPNFLCFINNDVLIDKEFGKKLNVELKKWYINQNLVITQPILFLDHNYNKIENAGINYYRTGIARQNRTLRTSQKLLINGACMFIKTSFAEMLFDRQGFIFQPQFFMYAEDVELSLRTKKMGYQTLVDKSLKAQHLESSSLGKDSNTAFFFYWRNLLASILLTRSKKQIFVDLPFIIWGQLILLGLSFKRLKPLMIINVYKSLASLNLANTFA